MSELKNWHVEHVDRVAWLTLDRPDASQNSLSQAVIEELDVVLDQVLASGARGLVIKSGKPASFIVGADVTEFTEIKDSAEALTLIRRAHFIFQKLETASMPSVAMIDGTCFGGGLELALACHYRVASDVDATQLGFPEVMLGIHPGFGGTVRAIETIGASAAMELMLSGRTLRGRQIKKSGLIDLVVPPRHLEAAVEKLLKEKPTLKKPGKLAQAANLPGARHALARVMRSKIASRANPKHYPAPYALIDLWETHGSDRQTMLDEEAASVARLVVTDTSRELVRVFFLQEGLKELGKTDAAAGSDFKHVHVVGAGIMGGDIAAWCAVQGMHVSIQDNSAEALGAVSGRAHKLFKRRLRDKHKITAAMDRFMPDPDGNGVARADVVIEAIYENVEAKHGLFRELEPKLKANAILATNTSSIPLETLNEALTKPERLVGLHFFNPVAKMQLVEIVSATNTSETEAKRAAAFARKISRLPVPVKSSPGFLVNRILMPYLMESLELLNEGVPAAAIDKVATDFGMPMGPVELADTVGLDICESVAGNLTEAFGGEVPSVLSEKVKGGQRGKKDGRGFYSWKSGKPEKQKVQDGDMKADTEDRLVLRFLNESVACLREGVVPSADELDAGVIFGTGFAPFRGGPINYINTVGAAKLHSRLQELATKYGSRFTPDDGWADLI